MTTPQVAKTLQCIVDAGLKNNPLPLRKGKTVFLGSLIVRSNSTGHVVVDTEHNSTVAKTFSLRAALAISKKYIKQENYDKVLELDKKYEKHHCDCIFYKHMHKKTKSDVKKEIMEHRIYTSEDEIEHCKTVLDRIILN